MTVADRAVLAPAPALDPRRWWALALLSSAFFMVVLDASIGSSRCPRLKRTSAFRSRGCNEW
jgi:hypothetical protein